MEKDPDSHSRSAKTVSMCLSRASRKVSKNFRIGVSSVSPENLKKDQGWLAASTEAIAANSHSFTSLRPRGLPTARYANGRHQRVTQFAKMKQNGPTLEDRDVTISQPRHLPEGLM